MPKQSRGFWVCNYCEHDAVFDQFPDAEYHERYECPAVARSATTRSTTSSPTAPATGTREERTTTTPQPLPVPINSKSSSTSGRHMVSTIPVAEAQHPPWHYHHHQEQQKQQHSTIADDVPHSWSSFRGMTPSTDRGGSRSSNSAAAAASSSVAEYEQQPKQQQQRYFPLMGAHDPSPLNPSDTLACRSTELFEMTLADLKNSAATEEGESSSLQLQLPDDRPVAGQVGLRCAFCAEADNAAHGYIFPANTLSVGDSLRYAAFDHLATCSHFPDDYKRQIQDALWNRKKTSTSSTKGSTTKTMDDNDNDVTSRRALIDYCTSRCDSFGIVDRNPVGLVFSDMPMFPIPPHRSSSSSSSSNSAVDYNLQRRDDRPYGQYNTQPEQQQPLLSQYRDTRLSKHGATTSTLSKVNEDGNVDEGAPLQESSQSPMDQHRDYRYPQQPQQQEQQFSPVPPPMEFPFFYEHDRWACKFCAHVPPSYRDIQYFWPHNAHSPPPPPFVDYHLSVCREFQKGMMYEQQQQMTSGPYSRATRIAGAPSLLSSPFQHYATGWEQHPPRGTSGPTTPNPESMDFNRSVVPSPYVTPAYHYDPHVQSSMHHHHLLHPSAHMSPNISMSAQLQSGISDMDIASAIAHLEAHDKSRYDGEGNLLPENERLVLDEDHLLLTDYFFYVMKQLRLVRFSESDRRTRGGKRELVKVGYGGLQCVHCVDVPNTRKFFWSNVDRLANSFAEIPGHLLKCRRCPKPTKDALLLIKQGHAEQMSRLPRGSQKVFFRRMWRRLHEGDPTENVERDAAAVGPQECQSGSEPVASRPLEIETGAPTQPHAPHASSHSASDSSPAGTSGSDESVYFLQRPALESAKALVDATIQSGPPTPSSRVLLAIPEDREWLSDTDCFVRRQLEVFCATQQDVEAAVDDRKYPVKEAQVGIRCIHCAMNQSGSGARGQAVAYPFSISGIYESAREFQRMHLENCENLPLSAKSKLVSLKGSSSLSSVLRKYFVLAAKALGLRDTPHGIRSGADPVPIGSQAAIAFSELPASDEPLPLARGTHLRGSPMAFSTSAKKRKANESPTEKTQTKKRSSIAFSLTPFSLGNDTTEETAPKMQDRTE